MKNDFFKILLDVAVPDSVTGILLWLEGQLDFMEHLLNKWKETAPYRFNLLLRYQVECEILIRSSGKCLVESYLNKYPFVSTLVDTL